MMGAVSLSLSFGHSPPLPYYVSGDIGMNVWSALSSKKVARWRFS